jgi:phage terminase large subunit-like protein
MIPETSPSTSPRTSHAPSLGYLVAPWIERFCIHGPGELAGEPARLRLDQRAAVYRYYELDANGRRRRRRVVRGRARGDGKTTLAAWIGTAELAGPVAFAGWRPDGRPRGRPRVSADVPVLANSFEQANQAFGVLRYGVEHGPLAPAFECFDTRIVSRPGVFGWEATAYRVAAIARTNEGSLPTFLLVDETHGMTGNGKRPLIVLRTALTKRGVGWSLESTTAGLRGERSVAEDSYDLGRAIDAGDVDVDGTLVDWLEADGGYDLEDPDQRTLAIAAANPGAGPEQLAAIADAWYDPGIPEHEFRRYHLNQWVDALEDSWLPTGAWAACRSDLALDDGADVWVGIDVALRNDSTAVVWAGMLEGRVVVRARVWYPPPGRLAIDHLEVMAFLRELAGRYRIRDLAYDPRFFEVPAQLLLDEGLPMREVPQTPERMVPACQHAFDAITAGVITHDGDPVLGDHVVGAVRREGERGWTLSKGKSRRKIDAAIALVLACWYAYVPPPPVPEPRIY